MTDLDREMILIDIIQHYPFLFDKSDKDYKDNNKKDNAWDSIAIAMSLTVEEVQKLWKNLREKYAKERKIIQHIPSGSGAGESGWPWYKYMGFMAKHIASRKRVSNVSRPTSSLNRANKVLTPQISPKENNSNVTPQISPRENNTNVWDNLNNEILSPESRTIESDEENQPEVNEVSTPKIVKRVIEDSQIPSSSKRTKSAEQTKILVEESLNNLNSYINKKKTIPDKNMAFGQYVALSLMDMPTNEQNEKKIKIVNIINGTD